MAVSLCAFFGTLALVMFHRPFWRARPALLDVPADDRAGRRTLLVILSVFLFLTLAAVVRHSALWDFSQIQNPRW